MCSHDIEKHVRERISREGLPTFTRRHLLKLGGGAAAGLAVAAAPMARVAAKPAAQGMPSVIDLSHVYGVEMPTYSPGESPMREATVTVEENGFFIQLWTLYEHSGTHMDFPAHFIADAATVDEYDVAPLYSPVVVIDVSAQAEADPDYMVSLADIEAYEAERGEIPQGAVVMMYSGWDTRWSDSEAFRNADADGVMHFPGFGIEAVTWLIENRAIHGVGVDTLSLDPGNSATFDVHYGLLGAGLFGIENVANLAAIKDMDGVMVVAGIPRWEASGGGPARILAIAGAM
jgi:kynurenine formamidase